MAVRPRHVLSLCAGIGGLELGVKIADPFVRVVCYVERNPYAVAVLRARMRDGGLDDAPIWDDLSTFDATPWRGAVDLVTAGYPCQSFSSAARGRYRVPDLSGEVLRVVGECRPAEVFVENVYHARKSLAALRRDLVGLGYDCPPLLDCRAADVGAPHQRKRLFLFGHAHGHRQPDLCLDAEVARLPQPDGNLWQDHADALGVPDGAAHRLERLEAVGNAVVPLVATYAYHLLRHRPERLISHRP